MKDSDILLTNLSELHTTKLGEKRIINNLNLQNADAVAYCKSRISDDNCNIYKRGKNFYCETSDLIITVNSYSYTIITAHRTSAGI